MAHKLFVVLRHSLVAVSRGCSLLGVASIVEPGLQSLGSAAVVHRLGWLEACGILVPPTKKPTRVPCIARWILNFLTTREFSVIVLKDGMT